MKEYVHLSFKEDHSGEASRKTKIWNCWAKTGPKLGIVKWWTGWRRYCFFPEPNMLFDADCLYELHEFCAKRTTEQKADQKQRCEAKL